MNVLKNYKILKQGNVEEFPAIKIRYNDTEVFAEMPVCVVPYENELQEPMLFKQESGIGVALEKTKLLEIIANQRIYYLKKDTNGVVREGPKEKSTHQVRLPKKTNVSELDIIGNQIFKVDKKEKIKPEEVKKPEKKEPRKE